MNILDLFVSPIQLLGKKVMEGIRNYGPDYQGGTADIRGRSSEASASGNSAGGDASMFVQGVGIPGYQAPDNSLLGKLLGGTKASYGEVPMDAYTDTTWTTRVQDIIPSTNIPGVDFGVANLLSTPFSQVPNFDLISRLSLGSNPRSARGESSPFEEPFPDPLSKSSDESNRYKFLPESAPRTVISGGKRVKLPSQRMATPGYNLQRGLLNTRSILDDFYPMEL